MGSGGWSRDSFVSYSKSVGRGVTNTGDIVGDYRAQDMFKSQRIDEMLNPKNVIRECVDSEEHPNTIPVILGLDVTGSMGDAAVQVAKKLNKVMSALYEKVSDVEFMIMGIGDLAYDRAPIQVSQFESDIRIAEQLDKVYFEGGGGGNDYESYTAAWYMGTRHSKLDCWKRGKKGIIITLGDEPLNPYLPKSPLMEATGDSLQADVETSSLYEEVTEKYDVYHIDVDHRRYYSRDNSTSWKKYLDDEHFIVSSVNAVEDVITDIILKSLQNQGDSSVVSENKPSGGGISW